jgi:hypothetical protein
MMMMATTGPTAASALLLLPLLLLVVHAPAPAAAAGHCDASAFNDPTTYGTVSGGMFELKFHGHAVGNVCFKIPVSSSSKTYAVAMSDTGKMPGVKDTVYVDDSSGKCQRGKGTSGYSGASSMQKVTACCDVTTDGGYAYVKLTDIGCTPSSDNSAIFGNSPYVFPIEFPGSFGTKHATTPRGAKCDLTSTSTCKVSTQGVTRSEKQTHGTMMVLAWIIFSSMGIFTGRFMRTVLGKGGFWFKIHMYSQLLTAALTLAGYIYITSKVDDNLDDKKDDDNPHRKVGIVVFVLAMLQVLLGFARNLISGEPSNPEDPNDHGPRRWIFQLLHITLGYTAWIMSVVAMSYGIQLLGGNDDDGEMAVDSSYKTVLFIWVAFTAAAFVVLEVMKKTSGADDKLGNPPSENFWQHAFAVVIACGVAAGVSLILAINGKEDPNE